MSTLVLVSPIPLVQEEQLFDEFSFLSTEQKGLKYSSQEVLTILDLIAGWVEARPQSREVILVSGGVSASFTTAIQVEREVFLPPGSSSVVGMF